MSYYKNKTAAQEIMAESMAYHVIDKITTDGGIKVHFEGGYYPQKGHAPAEALAAVNIAKKVLLQPVRFCASWYTFPILFLLAPKKKLINRMVRTYNDIVWKQLKPFELEHHLMTPMSRALMTLTINTLLKLGIDEKQAEKFGTTIGLIFEYDNSYRYRVQDLFTAVDYADLISKPSRTVIRMGKLAFERSGTDVRVAKNKRLVCYAVGMALFAPKLRSAARFALKGINYQDLCFDEIDMYWVCMRNDYEYLGEPIDVRSQRNAGKPIPRAYSIHDMERKKALKRIEAINANINEIMNGTRLRKLKQAAAEVNKMLTHSV